MLSIVISAIYYNYKKPVLREVSDKQEISIFEKRYNFNLIDGEKLEVVTEKTIRYHTGVRISNIKSLEDVKLIFEKRDNDFKDYFSNKLEKFDDKKQSQRNLDGKYRLGVNNGVIQVCEYNGKFVVEIWDQLEE